MDLRQRTHPPRPANDADPSGGTDAAPAAERATRVADFAERVIERALSQDSATFLRDRRQQGGQ